MIIEVTVGLPEQKYAFVERRAREEGRTVGEVIAEIVPEEPAGTKPNQVSTEKQVFDRDNLPTDEEIDAMTPRERTDFLQRTTEPSYPPHRDYKEEVAEYLEEKYR